MVNNINPKSNNGDRPQAANTSTPATHSSHTTAFQIPSFLKSLMSRIKGATNMDEALGILNRSTGGDQGLREKNGLFHYQNYTLQYLSNPGLEESRSRLKRLIKIDQNSYAKPLAIVEFNQGNEAFLLSESQSLDQLIPFSQAFNAGLITNHHIDNFLADTVKLTDAGLIPDTVFSSQGNCLHYNKNSDKLIHINITDISELNETPDSIDQRLHELEASMTLPLKGQTGRLRFFNPNVTNYSATTIPSPFRITSPVDDWETTAISVGRLGKNRNQKIREIDKKLGENTWRFAWEFAGSNLDFRSAIQLYENSYLELLTRRDDFLTYLVKNAKDIYDTHPSNILSGTDYFAQADENTHLQDIAIRRVLKKLGKSFEGDELIQIRSKQNDSSVGIALSPLNVKFTHPHQIKYSSDELRANSVEDFWQLNRVIQVSPHLQELNPSERKSFITDKSF